MERHAELRADYFTEYAPVRSEIESLRTAVKNKHFSDIIGDNETQYVDLVMEGGGMLGVALLGYVHALEEVGIRFLDLAGTSAGSITALLLAAVDDKDKKKSEKLLNALAQQNLSQFMDGNWGARLFSKLLMAKRFRFLRFLFGPFAATSLRRELGIHPGEEFESWVRGILKECGMDTAEKLRERMALLPGLKRRQEAPMDSYDCECRLSLIAAEVTTRFKAEFPKHAELFFEDPEQVNPARFVRASMSVPFFFHPMRVKLPKSIAKKRAIHWEKRTGGPVPGSSDTCPGPENEYLFIDGGIMSNFPINIFHREGIPSAPTFGVRLSGRAPTSVTRLKHLAQAIFDSARHTLDDDFIFRHPDYRHLLAQVDTTGYQWLNFDMKPEELRTLFLRGVQAGATFLKNFNWSNNDGPDPKKESYRSVRMELVRLKSEPA
ncbi:patatin-like phospholipase family protein [Pyxidicoccus trucidator]|uniref:patatin-like phospholipase family protein n=1 Tax=Pyxidicoccus trucidator TaxID=2709662 RepID=UPI0013DBDDEA|nr:patatin-like phospholipase family protein [Pyxidicoccus trucidator]